MRPFLTAKTNLHASLFCVFSFVLFSTSAFAQAGSLDLTFGLNHNGIDYFAPGFRDNYGVSIALLPDDKIVVQGYDWDSEHFVVCVDKDGYYDIYPTNKFDSRRGSFAMAVQSDSKLLLACQDYNETIGVSRYTVDTSNPKYLLYLDSSYASNGRVTTSFQASAMKVQDDNKLVIAGTAGNTDNYDFAVSRINENGSIDSSFGVNGIVITDFDKNDNPNSITIQTDGKILVAGTTTNKNGKTDFIVSRYESNGEPDSSFGVNGKEIVSFKKNNTSVPTLGLQADGRIILGGTLNDKSDSSDFVLAGLKSNGEYDSSFGSNGWVTTSFDSSSWEQAGVSSIALAPDGKIIMVGSTYNNAQYPDSYHYMALARYNTNGELDETFGEGGKVKLINNGYNHANSIALQKDGKIIVVGTAFKSGGLYYPFVIARFNAEGTLPITLSSFTATRKSKSIMLNWQTVSETNSAYFSVERKAGNNNTFTPIGKVTSKGNSNQLQQYSFEDVSPLSGTNYYRLKQVDADGKFTYSKTVKVDFGSTVTLKLYPNPVKDVLQLEGLNASSSNQLSIADASGKVVANTTVTGITTYIWNLKQLPGGVYYLSVKSDNTNASIKFVKE